MTTIPPPPPSSSESIVPQQHNTNNTRTIRYSPMMDEMSKFKKLIETVCETVVQSDTNVHLYLPMKCEDMNHTFLVNEILFRYEKAEEIVHMDVFYSVFHLVKKKEFIYTQGLDPDEMKKDVLELIFRLFYHYKLCPECLRLVERDTTELCEGCSFRRLRNVFGADRGWLKENDGVQEAYENCFICCHPVYHTRLQCGHYVHHTCLVEMLPCQWFSGEIGDMKKLRCAVCRKPLTEYDVNRYFRCK